MISALKENKQKKAVPYGVPSIRSEKTSLRSGYFNWIMRRLEAVGSYEGRVF